MIVMKKRKWASIAPCQMCTSSAQAVISPSETRTDAARRRCSIFSPIRAIGISAAACAQLCSQLLPSREAEQREADGLEEQDADHRVMAALPSGIRKRATCGKEQLETRESVAGVQTDDLRPPIGTKTRLLEPFLLRKSPRYEPGQTSSPVDPSSQNRSRAAKAVSAKSENRPSTPAS